MADVTIIELWPWWAECHRCLCPTRSKFCWPYYEEFLFGWADYDPEFVGYVPVCGCCYLELLNQDANDWTSVYGGSGRDRALWQGWQTYAGVAVPG